MLIDFPCPDGMIKCKDGLQCIPSKGRCDYYENCNDKSDEDEDFCRGNLAFSVIIYLSHILHCLFPSIEFYIADKFLELTNCESKSLRELPLFNLQIVLFRAWFQKYIKQCRSVQ